MAYVLLLLRNLGEKQGKSNFSLELQLRNYQKIKQSL